MPRPSPAAASLRASNRHWSSSSARCGPLSFPGRCCWEAMNFLEWRMQIFVILFVYVYVIMCQCNQYPLKRRLLYEVQLHEIEKFTKHVFKKRFLEAEGHCLNFSVRYKTYWVNLNLITSCLAASTDRSTPSSSSEASSLASMRRNTDVM